MKDDAVSKLIEEIYDTSLHPERWAETLRSVTSLVGCAFISLVPYKNPAALITSGMEAKAFEAYTRHWYQHDAMVPIGIARKHDRGLVCDWQAIGVDQIKRNAYYQEFRRDYGLGHCIGTTFEPLPGHHSAIALNFPYGPGPLEAGSLAEIGMILRHVSRALAISARVEPEGLVQPEIEDAIAQFQCGAAIVDEHARVLAANAAFEQIAGDGITITKGYLKCDRAEDQKQLQRQIWNQHVTHVDCGPETMTVSRASGRLPLVARAIPLSSRTSMSGLPFVAARKQVLLLVVDICRDVITANETALRGFGLTSAEARIAALVGSGRSPREAAAISGSTEGTVRNQLKQVFAKLQIAKQAELAHMVCMLSILG